MRGLLSLCSVWVFTVAVLLSACSTVPPQSAVAPVLPQVAEAQPSLPSQPAATNPAATPVDTPSKSDVYTVKPGDTLIRIGLDSGQSPGDIARWNGLIDPGKIVAGQVLRLLPPASGEMPTTVKSTTPAAATAVVTEELIWVWPGQGPVLTSFGQSNMKGIEIGGDAGDAVLAAADGKVIYAGAGLRGYGNLVILKHSNTYVSVYAHNQMLMVKEEEAVKRGQKIAEFGSSEADRIKLHFEVRKLGDPVDPAKYLPAR